MDRISLAEESNVFSGLHIGTLFPDGKNKVLGNPFMGGLGVEFHKWSNNYYYYGVKSNKGGRVREFSIPVTNINEILKAKKYVD